MIIKPKIFQGSGTYKVRFFYWDVVGGVLTDKVIERYVNAGGTVIAPAIPTTLSATTKRSPALEFDNWNITTLTNVQQDIDVGAIYKNATDGGTRKTHAFIVVTATTGYNVPIYYTKSDGSTLSISWGDGSENYTTTTSGNDSTSHIYSPEGTYEIKMWISVGTGTYGFGNGTSSTSFVGGNSNTYRSCLLNLFIGDNVNLIDFYGLYREICLTKLSLTNNISAISNSAFEYCDSLEVINIPDSVLTIGNNAFDSCIKSSNINLPINLTTIGNNAFDSCNKLNKMIFYNNITSFGTSVFLSCDGLSEVILPNGLTEIGSSVFSGCYGLPEITIPDSVTSIGANAFEYSGCLKSVSIPANVTSIGAYAFNMSVLNKTEKYIINRFTAPSTITTLDNTNAFTNINPQCRIYVPVGSGDVYKGATNWSTYANQIYENTAENRALFGD